MTDLSVERRLLVASLKERGYIRSPEVEAAMLAVPREAFLPPAMARAAYADSPQPIGYGQTISAPHMVAIMAEALEARPGDRVLEVGAGSGYHAAVVATIVRPGRVVTVEIVPELATFARENLARFGADNVIVVESDGSMGYPPNAPYDRIFVACGAPDVPPPLVDQLAEGGVLLIPVGPSGHFLELLRLRKRKGRVRTERLGGCAFVPLVGRYGFR